MFVASLCCLAPVVLVLFGLSTVAFATSLAGILYGQYKWVFRIIGLILLGISIFIYIRNKKRICTIDEVKKRRNEIINIVTIVLISGVVGYIIWLYVVIEFLGILLKIW